MPYEYLSIPSADILAKAYATQEKAYLENQNVQERLIAMEYLEQKFGYLLEKNEEKPSKKLLQKQPKI